MGANSVQIDTPSLSVMLLLNSALQAGSGYLSRMTNPLLAVNGVSVFVDSKSFE